MGVKKELNMKSLIYKFKNIEFIIYFDIGITLITILILIYSLIPNSFNIIPILIVEPLLGINRLRKIFESLHFILIGVSITFIIQSITLLFEYRVSKIESSSIVKLLFYKWIILTIISAIPYAFNLQIPTIFIILSLFILCLFWYKTLTII